MAALGGHLSLGGYGCSDDREPLFIALAIFEVDHEAALVSVFSPVSNSVLLHLRERSSGVILSQIEVIVDSASGVGSAELVGLAPSVEYELLALPDKGQSSAGYHFETAPPPDADVGVHFVYSADIDVSPDWQSPIFTHLAASSAQFFLCLGDWPYADNPPGAVSEDEFQLRHVEVRVEPRVQSLLQSMPCYAIYDDHELRNNWDAHFRDIEAERIETGLRVWDEWFPLHGPDRYRSIRRGQHLEIFILDTRLHRSANLDADDESKTMLGSVQFDWLMSALRSSDATFKVIATSVPLDYGMPEDSWAVFQTERDRLLSLITSEGLETVVFLCADQHFFCPHHFQNGIKEFQVGPLARGLFESLAPQHPNEVMRANVLNYGEVILEGGATPNLTLIGRDQNGEELYRERIDAGVGSIRIEGNAGRPFETSGAHIFRGTSPATFSYAAIGDYRLRWTDTDEEAASGTLQAGSELVLS
jgi:hypothetical protein